MIKAIVTGHSRGLGDGAARALLAGGAAVLGIARGGNPSLQQAFPEDLQEARIDLADARALGQWLDLGGLRAFLQGASQALLINNAGVVTPIGPPGGQGGAALAQAIGINVTAALMLADAFVAATAACPDRRILHVSSGAGRQAYAGWSAYCAGKAALDMHAQAVALDALPQLRIASVAPGVIDTAMQARIRTVDAADFPSIGRFVALKEDGALADADHAGAQLVAYALSARFGERAVADLRQL